MQECESAKLLDVGSANVNCCEWTEWYSPFCRSYQDTRSGAMLEVSNCCQSRSTRKEETDGNSPRNAAPWPAKTSHAESRRSTAAIESWPMEKSSSRSSLVYNETSLVGRETCTRPARNYVESCFFVASRHVAARSEKLIMAARAPRKIHRADFCTMVLREARVRCAFTGAHSFSSSTWAGLRWSGPRR